MVQSVWLLFGGYGRVRGKYLHIAMLILVFVLLGMMSAWAGSFSEVPSGHWAYLACERLATIGILLSDHNLFPAGNQKLTRFEFAISILTPLSNVDITVARLGANPDAQVTLNAAARALGISPRFSENEIATAVADLRHLGNEFQSELRALGLDPSRATDALQSLTNSKAVRDWRVEALAKPVDTRAFNSTETYTDTIRLPVGRGAFALTYRDDPRSTRLLDDLAAAATGHGSGSISSLGSTEPALRDPFVSRMRTAYEYGRSTPLTLSLAYEEIARRGQGRSPLDMAALASLGIGYRLSPSSSVKLSYSLLEYSNYALDSPPMRERVAETAVSIEF